MKRVYAIACVLTCAAAQLEVTTETAIDYESIEYLENALNLSAFSTKTRSQAKRDHQLNCGFKRWKQCCWRNSGEIPFKIANTAFSEYLAEEEDLFDYDGEGPGEGPEPPYLIALHEEPFERKWNESNSTFVEFTSCPIACQSSDAILEIRMFADVFLLEVLLCIQSVATNEENCTDITVHIEPTFRITVAPRTDMFRFILRADGFLRPGGSFLGVETISYRTQSKKRALCPTKRKTSTGTKVEIKTETKPLVVADTSVSSEIVSDTESSSTSHELGKDCPSGSRVQSYRDGRPVRCAKNRDCKSGFGCYHSVTCCELRCPKNQTSQLNNRGNPVSCSDSSDCEGSHECVAVHGLNKGLCCYDPDSTANSKTCGPQGRPFDLGDGKLMQCNLASQNACYGRKTLKCKANLTQSEKNEKFDGICCWKEQKTLLDAFLFA